MTSPNDDAPGRPGQGGLLPRHLCRVMGLNQNHSGPSGTAYHVQVEDRGPVFDDVTEEWVRRVNVIAYANYGEPSARIVYGRDHDLPDVRTHEHNREVARRIQELASDAVTLLDEKEGRQVGKIQRLLKRYYETREEALKRELDEVNRLYPFVFARAFQELRAERSRAEAAGGDAGVEAVADETVYPLDPALRELVLEVERVADELQRDVAELRQRGAADDILLATCTKLLARASDGLSRRHGADFASRHLEMTRASLVTTYRQVRARLTRLGRG